MTGKIILCELTVLRSTVLSSPFMHWPTKQGTQLSIKQCKVTQHHTPDRVGNGTPTSLLVLTMRFLGSLRNLSQSYANGSGI